MQGAGRRSGSRTAGSSRWSGGRTRRAGRGSRSLRPTGQVELGVILTWRLPGKRGTAGRGADEARRPRCVSLPPTYPSTRPLGGDAHEDGFFPDLEGTRKRLRTPFPGSRTGSNDHLPLWLITFREPPERPAVRGPAPFEPGRSAGGGVGADGGSPEGERRRRRRRGGWGGGLGAWAAVEREPETGRGSAASARRVAGDGLA